MFKNYFAGIQGIEIYPLILLVVFMLFFVIISIALYKAKKEDMDVLKHIPFDNSNL